jgi:hypothetical protein
MTGSRGGGGAVFEPALGDTEDHGGFHRVALRIEPDLPGDGLQISAQ